MSQSHEKSPVLIAKELLSEAHSVDRGLYLNRMLQRALRDPLLNDNKEPFVSTDDLIESVSLEFASHLKNADDSPVPWATYMRRLYGILPGDTKMLDALRRSLLKMPRPERLPALLSVTIDELNEESHPMLPLTYENLRGLFVPAHNLFPDTAVSVAVLGTLRLENGYVGPGFSADRANEIYEALKTK